MKLVVPSDQEYSEAMTNVVHVEREGRNRIAVRFDYDTDYVNKMRTVAGRSFQRQRKYWTVPLDINVCRQLRSLYGAALQIGPELRSWALEATRQEQHLKSMAGASAGDLSVLRAKLPTLWRALYLGPLGKHAKDEHGITDDQIDAAMALFSFIAGVEPWAPEFGSYQTADVRFLVDAVAPLNANHQGLGKTPEAIAEVFEAGREKGCHLVIAPSSAVDGTWLPELEKWTADAKIKVEAFGCLGTRKAREATLRAFAESDADSKWVIINPAMVQFNKNQDGPMVIKAKEKEHRQACKCPAMKAAHWHYAPSYPELFDVQWQTIINDEVHKGNIRNHRSITSKSMGRLKKAPGCKPHAMSGTPMKKKGGDIWGILNWLRPDVFTSSWNFWGMFFEIEDNGWGKKVNGLRPDAEEAFYRYLDPYVLRRTKDEALPWLPAKQHIDVMVSLEGKQRQQYDAMEAEGIAFFEDASVPQTSILAEFTRMRQFANAYHVIQDGKITPDFGHSAKLDALFDKLGETGILDGEAPDKTIIFSSFKEMIKATAERLEGRVPFGVISGETKDRKALMRRFQEGDLKVMLVVTSAGGVSLTLDAADTAHFIDEDWAPDVQEQAEDRIHRASRLHQVTIYHYIARGTIDEYIRETSFDKAEAHERILDIRRKLAEKYD